MTVAPQYPLQHSHLGDENPFELIPSRFGVLERWRVAALQTGEIGGLAAISDHVRNDAVGKLDEVAERERVVSERERANDARERVSDAREQALISAAKTLNDAVERFAELQCRADQEPEPQAKPPGCETDAALPGDPNKPGDDAPAPTGDLHDLPPKTGERADPAIEPDVRGEFLRRPDEEEFPNPRLAKPPITAQPISAGLD
jgi:hypothetical protein